MYRDEGPKKCNVMDEYFRSNPLFYRLWLKWPFSPEIRSQITGW